MENHKKRNLTFFTIGLMFMLSGIEYGKSIMTALWSWRHEIMVSLEQYLPGILAASTHHKGYGIWFKLNILCCVEVRLVIYKSPSFSPTLCWSQPSFCLQYGGISRFWRPHHTSWVWVCLPSVWADCSQARFLGSGQIGAKLQSPSSFSPIFLRLSVSNQTTSQEATGMRGLYRNTSLIHYTLHRELEDYEVPQMAN